MASKRNPAYLFLSNPPTDDRYVRALFHDREAEREHALATLASPELPRQLWAVHGPTRSGKSHFARRLMLAVADEGLPYDVVAVDANSKGSARAVLVQLFHELMERLPLVPGATLAGEASARYAEGRRACETIKPLVEGLQSEVSLEVQQRELASEGTQAGLKLGPQWLGVEASARAGTETSAARTHKVVLRSPTDLELVQWIGLQLDLHSILRAERRVLFFVDDVDLLARDGAEASDYSQALFDRLHALAQHPHGVVVLTVRQQSYNGREKEFQELAAIDLWSDPEDLIEVHRLHLEAFNEAQRVFHESALRWLAASVEGRVGVFLQFCRELTQKVPAAKRPIDDVKLREVLRAQFDNWRHEPGLVYVIDEVLKAVAEGRMQLVFPRPLPNNPLMQRLLVAIVGQPGAYCISRVYFDLLRTSKS